MNIKKVQIKKLLTSSAEDVWSVVGQIDRFDWVPGIESIKLDGDLRTFTMKSMGYIIEKIVEHDNQAYKISYTAIESPVKLNYHLACIHLIPRSTGCEFIWSTEVDPPNFADIILQSMQESFTLLESILKQEFPNNKSKLIL